MSAVPATSTARKASDGGTEVLEWLRSPEAETVARARLRRSGFPTSGELVDDVLGESALGVVRQRVRGAMQVDNPAAYGSTVIRNVVYRLVRGDTAYIEDLGEPIVLDTPDEVSADDVRVIIASGGAPAWLTAASLTYLTLLMYPVAVPEDAPTPIAGSRPDQARVWPSLWLAGLRDLFPDPCPAAIRRRRARRIAEVLEHIDDAFARYRWHQEITDG